MFETFWDAMFDATSTTCCSSAVSMSWTFASAAASFPATLIFDTACIMLATA